MAHNFSQPAPHPETLEACHALIDKLWAVVGDLSAQVEPLTSLLAAQKTQIAELESELARLKEKLGTNSSNSSKPPSSDPNRVRKKRKKGGKRGAKPGHPGHRRELVPPERVNELKNLWPQGPCLCGGALTVPVGEPRRHQVFELPPITAHVTEWRLFALACERCGRCHRAGLPPEAPTGMLGPRATALVGLLEGPYHLSRRLIQQLLADVFGLKVSLGTVSNTEAVLTDAMAPAHQEVADGVRAASVLNMDETSHTHCARRHWTWVAVTRALTFFLIRDSRSAEVAREILGESQSAILGADRYSAYGWVDPTRRQLCWAHLLRDFTRMRERPGLSQSVGKSLLKLSATLFEHWERYKQGLIERVALIEQTEPIRVNVVRWLEFAAQRDSGKTGGTCKKLLETRQALWTFLHKADVEPTNNAAERALRPFVIRRKLSFGTWSDRGDRFLERLLTLVATCRQQGRDVLAFLTQTLEAHRLGLPPPSLVSG